MDALQFQLHGLIFRYWKLPEREGRALLRALLTSPCSRVVTLRHQLVLCQAAYATVQGWRERDAGHMYAAIVIPEFVVKMLGDLQSVGTLTAVQVRSIEKAVLEVVDAKGAWKPRE